MSWRIISQNSYTLLKFQIFAIFSWLPTACFMQYLHTHSYTQSSSIITSKDQKIEPEIYNIIYDWQNYVERDI